MLEELRPRFSGIEHANSVSLDPHKWFFCPLTAEVSASGAAWFGTVRHQERTWLCFRLTNLYTREEHIERLVEIVETTAERWARRWQLFSARPRLE